MLCIKRLIYLTFFVMLTACSQKEQAEVVVATPEIISILTDKANPYDQRLDTVIDEGCKPLRTKWSGTMGGTFNDKNDVHMSAARAIGIKPIKTEADIWKLDNQLVPIKSCKEYYLEELTHSYPCLVPEAAQLLKDIGQAFNDSLAARGGGAYRIRVTSVLRTPATVKKLRRVNRNASEASVHSFGTTFDISHSKFVCDSITDSNRTYGDLKLLLAEILLNLRKQGRCYVKYEYKQSCFHITARPAPADL